LRQNALQPLKAGSTVAIGWIELQKAPQRPQPEGAVEGDILQD
jgi:hypothetical protein